MQSTNTKNFEFVLYEDSNTFVYIYNTFISTVAGHIGIQSAAGGKSTVFSNSTTIPASGTKHTYIPTISNPVYCMLGAVPTYSEGSSYNK